MNFGGYSLYISFELNNMSALMLAVAALASLTVHVLSAWSIWKDSRITAYYSYLSLFSFAVYGLMIAGDMLTLLVFWGLAGAGGFLIAGYDDANENSREAAKRLFIMANMSSVALLFAVILLFWYMPDHALDFTSIHNLFQGHAGKAASGIITGIALLLTASAASFAGLFPLHMWQPAAIKSREPFRYALPGLLMPAAAVYLLAKTYDLFAASPDAGAVLAYAGGITALLSAVIAAAQNGSLKAVSYVLGAQTGLAFLVIGAGSAAGGLYMLIAGITGFFLLNSFAQQDTYKKNRLLRLAGCLGALALSEFPLLIGYWSSSVGLKALYSYNPYLFVVALAAVLFKALALAPVWLKQLQRIPAASGPAVRSAKPAASAESEQLFRLADRPAVPAPPKAVMIAVGAVYALCGISAGFVQHPWTSRMASWIGSGQEAGSAAAAVAGIGAVSLLGLLLGWLTYRRQSARLTEDKQRGWLIRLLQEEWYIPRLIHYAASVPLKAAGRALQAFDDYIVGRRFW
ncbi:proton-conducting transporter membrane subunit [Paenibacillus protaetiae]|uniref:NADH:quinone oxidoreductase/Mrp antiporter transmembrane domain-containing protein n=1 Tax=Paenibacillus protaetiae TaxID=2509456 RepID=A0A4P6EY15_9BACL|nr:proton-conducting transporter membrane subunit [Paenibacillus protaetiae]QAY67716.1 hypothetical protein ET464_16330 [Paenibacillus protaetiae]